MCTVLLHAPATAAFTTPPTPAASLLGPLHPLIAAATHVKEDAESRSSLPLMALLSGACLFMSLPMCRNASSCHPVQQGWLRLLFYFMFGCLWRAESSVTALVDVMTASWAASRHYAVSEYDGDSFYGALHSLLAWGWMSVFTAHKWSGMHIFWVIRRTVRRHTQRETHAT